MGRLAVLISVGFVAACTNGLAERQAELAQWVGKPETALLGSMGAPNRSYETGGMTFLTYEERHIEIEPGAPPYLGPGYFGPGPFWYDDGLAPVATTLSCKTTFTVSGGVVRSFSLRGNACG